MNKIHKLAFKALKKWRSSNNWYEITDWDCSFCYDVDKIENIKSACRVCAAPKILCGDGHNCLYMTTEDLYDSNDDFNPKKSIRLMRRGLIYLMLFGRLPGRFVKRVGKHIKELNKEYDEIDF